MVHAYCTLAEVKSSLSGDVPNMGTSHDQSLVDKIVEVSRDIDRKIGQCREDSMAWSFYANRLYGSQILTLSSTPSLTSGTFTLTFAGETTLPVAFDADSESVRVALVNLSGVEDGNLTVEGNPGGPWTVTFAGLLTGPQPNVTGFVSGDVADARVVTLPVVSGVLEPFTERLFVPTPDLYGRVLMIDDCVEIQSVSSGSEGSEWRRYPLNKLPVEGLKGADDWPEIVTVKARWGYADEIPQDVREVTIIETIRGHFAGLAGNDDRLGMTPYGSVITSKAFTAKFVDLVKEYGNKLW